MWHCPASRWQPLPPLVDEEASIRASTTVFVLNSSSIILWTPAATRCSCRWMRRPPSGPTPQCCWVTWPATCRVRWTGVGFGWSSTSAGQTCSLLSSVSCCLESSHKHRRLPASPPATEATCKKVLLNAFTRALRDGFPPARVAGLKAIVASARYHSPEDAAARVLPAVGPLCVDPVHEVRASALACVEHFTKVLVENNKRLEAQAAAQAAESGDKGAAGSAAGGSSGSLMNSFGWAVSGLGLGSKGAGSAADLGRPGPAAPAAPAAAAPAAQPAPAATAPAPPRAAGGAPAAAAATASSSGWEEDDGWEAMDSGAAGEFVCGVAVAAACCRCLLLPSATALSCPAASCTLHQHSLSPAVHTVCLQSVRRGSGCRNLA